MGNQTSYGNSGSTSYILSPPWGISSSLNRMVCRVLFILFTLSLSVSVSLSLLVSLPSPSFSSSHSAVELVPGRHMMFLHYIMLPRHKHTRAHTHQQWKRIPVKIKSKEFLPFLSGISSSEPKASKSVEKRPQPWTKGGRSTTVLTSSPSGVLCLRLSIRRQRGGDDQPW